MIDNYDTDQRLQQLQKDPNLCNHDYAEDSLSPNSPYADLGKRRDL